MSLCKGLTKKNLPCKNVGKYEGFCNLHKSQNKAEQPKTYVIANETDLYYKHKKEVLIIQRLFRNKITKKKHSIINKIFCEVVKKFNNDVFKEIKTKKGQTQLSEKKYSNILEKIFENLIIDYVKVGSQTPYDYILNIDKLKIYLEVKKTDNITIIFNDTKPTSGIYYILICTKKQQILFVDGKEFESNDKDVIEFEEELKKLKDRFVGKKLGKLEVYPRPTFRSNINFLLDKANGGNLLLI